MHVSLIVAFLHQYISLLVISLHLLACERNSCGVEVVDKLATEVEVINKKELLASFSQGITTVK